MLSAASRTMAVAIPRTAAMVRSINKVFIFLMVLLLQASVSLLGRKWKFCRDLCAIPWLRFSTLIIGFFFSSLTYPGEIQNQIIQGIGPGTITIIGEDHRRPESIRFFESIVSGYLQQDKCLVVALEIASSQQVAIDKVVQGRAEVSSIKIPPMIDHPAYRAMLSDLAGLKQRGSCIELIAIDADLKTSTPRDEWMAKILEYKTGTVPVLALLGSLHALKRVDWDFEKSSPYVAEILTSLGYQVKTFPQVWQEKTCNSHNQLLPPDSVDAVRLINSSLISVLNAYEYKALEGVVDGVVLWECG